MYKNRRSFKLWPLSLAMTAAVVIAVFSAATVSRGQTGGEPATLDFDPVIRNHAQTLLDEGREIFRFDTFGSEVFWGDALKLHQAIKGAELGGVGPGVSPKTALSVGLKVDVNQLPPDLVQKIKRGEVDLDAPATTLALLKQNAVIGVKGTFRGNDLVSLGTQCALCHTEVDNAVAPGIGNRLDGWANRDLNVGAIIALAPDLSVLTNLLGASEETVRDVLLSWGPGKFDAELVHDGKAFRPDGKPAATLIPPAFGLAGVNLHTWTGWGSVTHWNAYVGNTQMQGQGTFYDPRLNDPQRFPIAARTGSWNVRNEPDLITSKLAALHVYQLSIPAPKPPAGSFDAAAARRGEALFNGQAQCARCHVPPLFTEPGWNMHTAEEIGIDDFQAQRSPDGRYRTAPLKGLWTHEKGGFYHDGRFATLTDVVAHYNAFFGLGLSNLDVSDVVVYLKSLGDAPIHPFPTKDNRSADRHRARLVITVLNNGQPIPGLVVSLGRSVAGRATVYQWEGTTDENGVTEVEINTRQNNATGIYVVRAADPASGQVIGQWGSLPVNGGTILSVTLPVGEAARLESEVSLTERAAFTLHPNAPNPFNPSTQLSYQILEPGEVSLVIYNTGGQRVRALVQQHQDTGSYSVLWDGTDNVGRQVASGLYFARMEIAGQASVQKMLFVK